MKPKHVQAIADLRFSFFILLLISLFSIIGTIIEQDQSLEMYKLNYPLNKPVLKILTWDRILQFELDHVYTTWWFLSLICLFGLSLILCTFLQQIPSLKIARRCQFFRKIRHFYRLEIFTILTHASLNKILMRIKENQYCVFQQKNTIYCYKGLLGCIAPILVHCSMILILFGTIIGSLFGFKAQEIVPKTEHFHIQNAITVGQFSSIPHTSARINDFWITYTKSSTISQFYSDISILNQTGNEIKRKTVAVNSPLIYRNIYYYQTDWNLSGLRLQLEGKDITEYPLIDIIKNKNKIWLTGISNQNFLNDDLIILIDNIEGYCSLYNRTGVFLGNLELNETSNFGSSLTLLEILSSTGLQIKTDPSLFIIYSGFLLLMLSTLISYTTYSQLWIIQKNKSLFIGGTTNRAVFGFELEFFQLIQEKI